MENNKKQSVDQNDQIMAALAHITVLLPMMGVVAPIVIWATQKDKSEFVAFQALQAVAYQLLMIVGWFVGMALYMCSFFGGFLAIPVASISEDALPIGMLGMFIPFIIFGGMMIVGLVYVIYGCYAAVMVFQGKDFRYILIGKRLEKYLERDRAPKAQQD